MPVLLSDQILNIYAMSGEAMNVQNPIQRHVLLVPVRIRDEGSVPIL